MSATLVGSNALVTERFVLEKIEYFTSILLWPRTVQPQRWLDNFSDSERPYAAHLLNSFAHFNQEIVDQLFMSAFQLLSCEILPVGATLDEAVQAWTQFRDRALITPVSGEDPSPADSGYRYATKARDLLGFPQSQLATHEQALKALVRDATQPIIFVDDFLGSADQILKHWDRSVPVNGTHLSFSIAANAGMTRAYYCCAFATDYGVERIAAHGLPLTVRAGNILPANSSAVAPESLVWPKSEFAKGVAFLNAANARAGIVTDSTGFHGLGLTIGIEGRVPDATLPIFSWDRNDWSPLFRRVP